MKKIIVTIIAITLMMMTMASCTERSTSRTHVFGTNEVIVHERVMKDGEVIEETRYTEVYDSIDEAIASMYEK